MLMMGQHVAVEEGWLAAGCRHDEYAAQQMRSVEVLVHYCWAVCREARNLACAGEGGLC